MEKKLFKFGLRFKTNKKEKERDNSHDKNKMKETNNLIILLRYMQKHTQENLRPAQIPVFEGRHNER